MRLGGRVTLEDRVDDLPGGLDRVLPGQQRAVTGHGAGREPVEIAAERLLDDDPGAGGQVGVAGDADHRDAQLVTLGHRTASGEDLLVGEVLRGAEQDEGVGLRG